MAMRRRMRIWAIDIAQVKAAKEHTDWQRFIDTGEIGQRYYEPLLITPLIAYHIRRIKDNDGHFVEDDGSDPFVPEDN